MFNIVKQLDWPFARLTASGALCEMISFHPQQVKFCAMHTLNLGYVLWAAGSCIESLLYCGLWGGADVSYDEKLKRAWHDFVQWAKRMKCPHLGIIFFCVSSVVCILLFVVGVGSLRRHSQGCFYLKSPTSPYPELHSKAYNAPWIGCVGLAIASHCCTWPAEARVVTAWLSDLTCTLMKESPGLHAHLGLLMQCMFLGCRLCHLFCFIYCVFVWPRFNLGEWFNVSERNPRILDTQCARHMMDLSDT